MKPNRYAHITDQELLDRFYESGDNQWLGILLQRYTVLLLGLCMKYLRNEEEAKDCVQQVFLKTLAELHKYKVTYFKSWLYQVARNQCLMKLRDEKGKQPQALPEKELPAAESENPDALLREKDQQLDRMYECLQQLNPEQKLCVSLFYLEKKSYQEISEATGWTLMQVKSHLQNGKRNLKILFEKSGPAPKR